MIARFKYAGLIKLSFLIIFVFSFSLVNGAKIYFNDVYKGTGTNYAEQTNSISNIQFITGSAFTFTSSDPADVTFKLTGNNVAGTLSYINSSGVKQSIIGQVSRQDKSGCTTIGLYFFTNTNEAYLLVIPGVTSYSSNTNVSTSSDPILTVMNNVLSTQNSQPKISVNDVTVNNTDAYAVFTVSLSSAANANTTFTPTLTGVSATLNTDFTNSMQYYNGSTWVNITSTVTIAQGSTSIQIRVPILNAGAGSSRTFNLNTGSVTGSNVLNSDGAYGVGTILPTPTITTSGSLKTFTSCSGCSVNPQSFTVSGANLTADIILTAPTGIQISTSSNSGFATSVTLTQVSNSVTTTTIYTKLTNNSTTASSGTISVTSTGATSKTITVTVNTDNALNFDGVNDKVTIADNNALDLTTSYTIEAWVKPAAFTSLGGIVSKYHSAASNGYVLRLTGTGNNSGVSFDEMNTADGVLSLNKWYHIAAVNNNGTRKLYINGVEQVLTGTPLTTAANSDPVIIGQDFSSNGSRFFNGTIDEVRIWNTARTLTQINDNKTNSLAGNESGLVAYYKFDQGIINGTNTSITTLTDYTSNSLTGTLSGVSLTGTSSNFVNGFIPEIKTYTNANVNNNALSFDGTNDYVISNVSGASASSFTIEAFVNPANTSGTKGILQWASGSTTAGNPMVLFQQDGTNLRVYVNSGYNLITSLSANTWSHIALVYSNSLYTLYVNGTSVATYSGPTTFQANATQFYLGTGYPTTWGGLIDEVRIWNTARSASEINKNMYNDLLGNESGLMAYYNFNQGNANGTNTGTLTDKTSNANNGTFMNFALTGSSSNFVPGNSQIGSSATFSVGTTYQLASSLSGGTWSSNNTAVATVNSSTGVVTGVEAGSASITYTICNKTVSYPVEIFRPTITVNNTLKTFTSCSGCSITPQSFTVSASDLAANVTVTAPTGFELSSSSGGTYSSTLTLSQTSGTVSSTVYVRLTNSATTASSGNITLASTGAVSKTVTLTVNTDNAFYFDGTNDNITVNPGTSLDFGTGDFTAELWVKQDDFSRRMDYFDRKSTGRDFGVFVETNAKLNVWTDDATGSPTSTSLVSNSTLTAGKWNHIAVVRSGSTLMLYINGVLDAQVTGTLRNITAASGSLLQIGVNSGSFYLKGSIDELRFWNVARSGTDISNSMYSELNGNEPNLTAYYNFNQGIASGSNSSITSLIDRTGNSVSSTFNNLALTGNSSNFVAGAIPNITAAGNATSVLQGNTLQLSNGLIGGTWSTSASGIATINSSGLVTGISSGSVTLTYTICSKSVSYNLSVVVPTLTTSSLKTFTSCSGCTIDPQSFTISGTNLSANVTLAAPTGFVMATTATGTYVTSLTYTPTVGTLSSTTIFAKLSNSATTATSGNFTVASTGATSKTVTATVNTDNSLNFDGIDDLVILDNTGSNSSFAFTGTNNFTLEAWVKRKSTSSAAEIISKFNAGVAGNYHLYINTNGYPVFAREADPWSVTGLSQIPENEWHHIAAVFNGSTMKIK